MYRFGELSDPQMAEKIIGTLKSRGIEAWSTRDETTQVLSLFVKEEESLEAAFDCFRVHLGFAPRFEIPPEMAKIQRIPWGLATKILMLVGVSLGVGLLYTQDQNAFGAWFISESNSALLSEVRAGEIWRLWTPMFLHFGILHIVFNMICFKDFGSLVEYQHGLTRYLSFIAICALVSNIGQYFVQGPLFGGFSGVLFGLLGWVWMYIKFNPQSPFSLPKSSVVLLLVWFFLCLFGIIPNVANTAHALGLTVGMLAGIAFGLKDREVRSMLPAKELVLYSVLSIGLSALTLFIEGFKLKGQFYYLQF